MRLRTTPQTDTKVRTDGSTDDNVFMKHALGIVIINGIITIGSALMIGFLL